MTTVSVVIATIPGREDLLERAVKSVMWQTRSANETVVELDEHLTGAGATRNRAMGRAKGEYVAILDDDDELLPSHLADLATAAEEADADVVYPWFVKVVDGREVDDRDLACPWGGRLTHPLGVPFGPEQAQHMRHYAFIPSCLLLRRQMALEVGGYPGLDDPDYKRYRHCEDWALLVRMLDAGAKFIHVPKRTWRLHLTSRNTAGRPWNVEASR